MIKLTRSIFKKAMFKRAGLAVTGGLAGLLMMAIAPASALERPDPCDYDHDHRSHHADYYDYYKPDRYYRAGPYRSGASFSVSFGKRDYDRGYRGRRGYVKSGYYDKRDVRRRGGSKLIKRDVYNTRYRARIVLKEELFYGRYGKRLVCTVNARGPEKEYIPYRNLKRVAYKNCSRRAQVKINQY